VITTLPGESIISSEFTRHRLPPICFPINPDQLTGNWEQPWNHSLNVRAARSRRPSASRRSGAAGSPDRRQFDTRGPRPRRHRRSQPRARRLLDPEAGVRRADQAFAQTAGGRRLVQRVVRASGHRAAPSTAASRPTSSRSRRLRHHAARQGRKVPKRLERRRAAGLRLRFRRRARGPQRQPQARHRLGRPDQAGIDVVTPNPSTSGSARWNILAAYGGELKEGKTAAQALDFVKTLITKHVSVQDRAARPPCRRSPVAKATS